MLKNPIWQFVAFIILVFPFLSNAQNFTAQAFCENPYLFICETDPVLPEQNPGRQRMLEIIQNLRQQYPSVDTFVKNNLSNPITDEELQNFGNLFESAVMRAEANAWNTFAGTAFFDNFSHEFIINKTFNEEDGQRIAGLGTRPSEVIGQLPDSHLRRYMNTLLVHSELSTSGEYSRVKNLDPFLAQVTSDFMGGDFSPISMYRFNLEAALSSEVDQMAAGMHGTLQTQFTERRERMATYLRENAPPELRDTMLARLNAQNLIITDPSRRSQWQRCYAGHAFGGYNGFQDGNHIEYCPGHALRHQSDPFHEHWLFAHEIAHAFDSQDLPEAYSNVISCMSNTYANRLLNTQGQPISTMEGEPRQRATTRVSREWIADSFAASFMAHEMRNQNVSQTEALSIVQRQYRSRFCRGGEWTEDHHGAHTGHPPDRIRLEVLLAGNSDMQAFFGCNRFANSRPQNNCQHFNPNTARDGEIDVPSSTDPVGEEADPVSPTLER